MKGFVLRGTTGGSITQSSLLVCCSISGFSTADTLRTDTLTLQYLVLFTAGTAYTPSLVPLVLPVLAVFRPSVLPILLVLAVFRPSVLAILRELALPKILEILEVDSDYEVYCELRATMTTTGCAVAQCGRLAGGDWAGGGAW